MANYKCRLCSNNLIIDENTHTAKCSVCGIQRSIPNLEQKELLALYDKAYNFCIEKKFFKAQPIFEQILESAPLDADIHWSILLCHYGVFYAKNPNTNKYMGYISKNIEDPIFSNSIYKKAISLANDTQKAIFQKEANFISKIQTDYKIKNEAQLAKKQNNIKTEATKTTKKAPTPLGSLIIKAHINLSIGNFGLATIFTTKIIESAPENFHGYLLNLMLQCRVKSLIELQSIKFSIKDEPNYLKAYKFASKEIKKTLANIKDIIELNVLEEAKLKKYNQGIQLLKQKKYKEAGIIFNQLADYKDSKNKALYSKYEMIYHNLNYFCEKKLTIKKVKKDLISINLIKGYKNTDAIANELKNKLPALINTRKKNNIKISIASAVITFIVIISLLTTQLFIPKSHMNNAEQFIKEGKYIEALKEYNNLEHFEDAKNKTDILATVINLTDTKYTNAEIINLLNSGVTVKTTYDLCSTSSENISYDNPAYNINTSEYTFSNSETFPNLPIPSKDTFNFLTWRVDDVNLNIDNKNKWLVSLKLSAIWKTKESSTPDNIEYEDDLVN